jgi:hypothetical protein
MIYLYNIYIFLELLKIKGFNYINGVLKGNTNEVDRVFHNKHMLLIDHVNELIQDPTYVIDNIYLGNSYNSTNIYTLKKFGIEKIINVTQEIPCSFSDQIEYLVIPIRDTRDNFIEKYLEKSN